MTLALILLIACVWIALWYSRVEIPEWHPLDDDVFMPSWWTPEWQRAQKRELQILSCTTCVHGDVPVLPIRKRN